MADEGPNQRKEPRYPLDTTAILERVTGEQLSVATLNVSGGGMLIQTERAPDLQVGEELCCSVLLYPDKPPQSWGVGTVVRVEDLLVAIEFKNVSVMAADFE
jgi:hypothetical protein